MSAIIKQAFDAFIKAGTTEEKTSGVAHYSRHFNKIEVDLLLVKWMLGVLIAVEVIPLLKTWLV